MKWRTILGSAVLVVVVGSFSPAAKAACTPTGFYVDSINMTAALINPGQFNGQTLDATGCNIGIYFDDGTDGGAGVGGSVYGATIENANYFGIVVNGGGGHAPVSVSVQNSTVTNIAENPPNGDQHGNAIFYINGGTSPGDDSRTCGADNSTTGTIYNNTVSGYQKNGITVKCPGVNVTISNNTVTGAGAVDYIAQNGIEVGLGALANVSGNTVSENEYTGTNDADSSGILAFGGSTFGGAYASNETISGNQLTDNDVGIFSVNCDTDSCTAPTTPTNDVINGNKISNDESATNISGCGPVGYQAGISEVGLNDMIKNNKISGQGYGPSSGIYCAVTTLLPIDTTGSGNLKQFKTPGGPLQKNTLPSP